MADFRLDLSTGMMSPRSPQRHGFATIQPADNQCVRPRDSYGQLSGPNPCDHSTGIIYKSATTSVMPSAKALASTGMYVHGSIVNTGSVEENKRALTWAYL